MAKDDFYEKFGLLETAIDFEFHLDENDVKDAERIDKNVRIIEINCTVEFGFEHDPKDSEDVVTISMGFAGVKMDRMVFEEALKRYRLRDIALKELVKDGEKKRCNR
jgi:hypothetical protein